MDHVLIHVTSENVMHVYHRKRTWRILSTSFNSKETTYLLFVYEQAYLTYLKKYFMKSTLSDITHGS